MLKDLSNKLDIFDYENNNSIKYTFETIEFLKKEFPNHSLNMILGVDQFNMIDSWKNHKYILNNVGLSVISRPGYNLNMKNNKIKFVTDIELEVSSEYIKDNMADIDKIKSMLDQDVLNYIIKNNLYK
tara:strand:- start:53 stop:436 length:384 start_codon:yes stop_codon:yes gene_type:complete